MARICAISVSRYVAGTVTVLTSFQAWKAKKLSVGVPKPESVKLAIYYVAAIPRPFRAGGSPGNVLQGSTERAVVVAVVAV